MTIISSCFALTKILDKIIYFIKIFVSNNLPVSVFINIRNFWIFSFLFFSFYFFSFYFLYLSFDFFKIFLLVSGII